MQSGLITARDKKMCTADCPSLYYKTTNSHPTPGNLCTPSKFQHKKKLCKVKNWFKKLKNSFPNIIVNNNHVTI